MQIHRLFEIVYVLLDKKKVTAKELACRFEVSERTIYRDVEVLSSAGIPIYTVKRSESAGDYSYSRVMRIETAMDAYEGNFLDKVIQACYEDMEYSLKRIKERLDMQKWLGTETEPTETT